MHSNLPTAYLGDLPTALGNGDRNGGKQGNTTILRVVFKIVHYYSSLLTSYTVY